MGEKLHNIELDKSFLNVTQKALTIKYNVYDLDIGVDRDVAPRFPFKGADLLPQVPGRLSVDSVHPALGIASSAESHLPKAIFFQGQVQSVADPDSGIIVRCFCPMQDSFERMCVCLRVYPLVD